MPDRRGGVQRPRQPAPVSGPGALSRRTDGKQPIRSERFGDRPDMQFGDRQKLEAGQALAPLPQAPPTSGLLGGTEGSPRRGQVRSEERLPPWLLQMPSARPGEPISTGLPVGPGPGPEALMDSGVITDEREAVLDYLYRTFGNEDARRQLVRLQNDRAENRDEQTGVPFGGPLGR